jgi:hypothetical protein
MHYQHSATRKQALDVMAGHMPFGEWNGTFLKGGSVGEYTADRDKASPTASLK